MTEHPSDEEKAPPADADGSVEADAAAPEASSADRLGRRLAAEARSAIEGARPHLDRIKEGTRLHVDRLKEQTQPHIDRLVEEARPRVDRIANEVRPRVERFVDEAKPRVEQLIDGAKPRVEKLIDGAKPRVEKAASDATRYAREHDQEIRGAASTLLFSRSRGGWRLALNSLAGNAFGRGSAALTCAACGSANGATARFCDQCGSALRPPASP